MSYAYETERPAFFTESGQVMFLKIRDNANRLISLAGAARFQEITKDVSGDSWTMLACVDRLVELGELREVAQPERTPGQYRIFVKWSLVEATYGKTGPACVECRPSLAPYRGFHTARCLPAVGAHEYFMALNGG